MSLKFVFFFACKKETAGRLPKFRINYIIFAEIGQEIPIAKFVFSQKFYPFPVRPEYLREEQAATGGMKQGHAPREVRSTLPPAHNPRRFRRGIGRSPLPPKNIPAPRCFTPSYAQIHNILWITQKFFTRYCLSPLDNGVWRCYNKGLHEKRDRKHFYKAGKGEDYVPSHQERRADRGI